MKRKLQINWWNQCRQCNDNNITDDDDYDVKNDSEDEAYIENKSIWIKDTYVVDDNNSSNP